MEIEFKNVTYKENVRTPLEKMYLNNISFKIEKNGIYYAKDLFLLSLDLFLLPYSEFVNKFEKLKQKLGNNYINKLSEDISLIEIMYD